MISLPENWSDWSVTGELGSGSYSVVYEAQRKDDPSIRCAIKQVTVPQETSEYDDLVAEGFTTEMSRSFFEEAIQDYTREIRLMENFKGMQNIVSIEDYKVVPKEDGIGSCIYIRMELLTSLEKYLSDKTLTEKEILKIGVDISTALEFCQEKKIIHRDVKPANIFVNDRLGTHVFYKLGDFGIARNLEGKTQGFSAKGTPNYMAPEVAAGLPYDSTADIYSLGLTLYWLLNGKRLPFFPQTQLYSPAAKREALARRLAGENLPPPVNAGEDTARVILKACAFSKEKRFQNARELKEALLHVMDSEEDPISAENQSSGNNQTGDMIENQTVKKPRKRFPRKGLLLAPLFTVLIFLITRQAFYPEIEPEQNIQTVITTDETLAASDTSAMQVVQTVIPITAPTVTSELSYADAFPEAKAADFDYRIEDDGTVTITGYHGGAEKIAIPAWIEGHPVISWEAFPSDTIQEVLVPDSVTAIDSNMFAFWPHLIRVYLPATLETIRDGCFNANHELGEICISQSNPNYAVENGVLFDKQMTRLIAYPIGCSTSSYIVPETITTIGRYAFSDAKYLTRIVLPDSLARIEEGAFSYCQELIDIVLPDHLQHLGGYAFDTCCELEGIHLPGSLSEIGSNPFINCKKLTRLTVAEENIRYYAISGILFDRDDRCLIFYPPERKNAFYTVPSYIRVIGPYAFYENPYLIEVELPELLISIKDNAFNGCRELISVSIPDHTSGIGQAAFYGCHNLRTVILPDTLLSLQDYVFSQCSALSEITLPATLQEIGRGCFYNCVALHALTVPETVRYIASEAFDRNPLLVLYVVRGSYAEQYCVDNRVRLVRTANDNSEEQDALSEAITETLSPESVPDWLRDKSSEIHDDQNTESGKTSTLGDTCWLDLDGDGLQNYDEPGIPNVRIELIRDGELVSETTSDSYGNYFFEHIDSGDYILRVIPPGEVIPTVQRTDIPLICSVLHETTEPFSLSDIISLIPGENRFDADLGFVCRETGVFPRSISEEAEQK